MIVVPDASVILKWVLPTGREADRDQALELLRAAEKGRIALKAPALWLYETGNLLGRTVPAHVEDLMQDLLGIGLDDEAPVSQWLDGALALMRAYQVTFYDAAYHALAISEKGTFVTADARYVSRVRDRGNVRLLSEWSM
jgi:predicted nucleic acid-binding protein